MTEEGLKDMLSGWRIGLGLLGMKKIFNKRLTAACGWVEEKGEV